MRSPCVIQALDASGYVAGTQTTRYYFEIAGTDADLLNRNQVCRTGLYCGYYDRSPVLACSRSINALNPREQGPIGTERPPFGPDIRKPVT